MAEKCEHTPATESGEQLPLSEKLALAVCRAVATVKGQGIKPGAAGQRLPAAGAIRRGGPPGPRMVDAFVRSGIRRNTIYHAKPHTAVRGAQAGKARARRSRGHSSCRACSSARSSTLRPKRCGDCGRTAIRRRRAKAINALRRLRAGDIREWDRDVVQAACRSVRWR